MDTRQLFTRVDRSRLGTLLDSSEIRSIASWNVLDELEWRLEESDAVAPERIPGTVVTMNSTLRLINLDSDREMICTIVYPDDIDLIDDGVSVIGPIGSALIGHQAGDQVEWWKGSDAGRWRIVGIISQPEQVGHFHL